MMVWINDSEFTHASICVGRRNRYGEIDSLLRIVDYERDINNNDSYTWSYRKNTPWEVKEGGRTNPEDPATLYRPETLEKFRQSGNDYLFVKWKPNVADPERPQLKDPYAKPYGYIPPLYEVIDCPDVDKIDELQKRLMKGWSYSGNPTKQILVLYSSHDDNLDAVLMERNDFDLSNGWIRLKSSASISAEKYVLNRFDVKYLPLTAKDSEGTRAIYIKPFLPQPRGKVMVQSPSRYATQYIQWYISTLNFNYSETEQQHIVALLEKAFQAPERLDEFNTAIPQKGIAEIRTTIKRLANENKNQIRLLMKDTLYNDPHFKRECMDECRQEALRDIDEERSTKQRQIDHYFNKQKAANDNLLEQQRRTISELEEKKHNRAASHDRLEKMIAPLQERVDELNRQLQSAQSDLEQVQQQKKLELDQLQQQGEEELANLERQKEEALSRFDKDVALKLGLKSVIETITTMRDSTQSTKSNSLLARAVAYPSWPVRQGNKPFINTLADNLREYGIVSVSDSTSSILDLADAIARSKSATNLLALDSTFAVPIANAITYATYGTPAKHVSISADWNDASVLEQLLSNEDNDVLVMDNVFDTVNEGLLFSLSRLESDVTIILPVGSYGNLRLISSEIWNHVFYLPTEQYIKMPAVGGRMSHTSAYQPFIEVKQQDIISEMTNRLRPSVTNKMPISSLVLPSSIAARFNPIDSGEKWVSAHIALQTYAAFGMEIAQSKLANDRELRAADKLLKRIGDSHHA